VPSITVHASYLSDVVQLVATTSTRSGLRSAATTDYVTPIKTENRVRPPAIFGLGGRTLSRMSPSIFLE